MLEAVFEFLAQVSVKLIVGHVEGDERFVLLECLNENDHALGRLIVVSERVGFQVQVTQGLIG